MALQGARTLKLSFAPTLGPSAHHAQQISGQFGRCCAVLVPMRSDIMFGFAQHLGVAKSTFVSETYVEHPCTCGYVSGHRL